MRLSSVVAGCALAAVAVITTSTAALAAPGDPEPIQFVPFDQATIYDPADVTPAVGGLLLADGTNVCAVNPESIALSEGTYPCFSDYGFSPAIPGARYAVDPPRLVSFDEATVVDPNIVRIVPGGLITADGVDLCTENPGSIVFPDGRYPCYINFVQAYDYYPSGAELFPDGPPQAGQAGQAGSGQVQQLPVGGADTGIPTTTAATTTAAGSGAMSTATLAGAGVLGMTVMAVMTAGATLALQARPLRARRRS